MGDNMVKFWECENPFKKSRVFYTFLRHHDGKGDIYIYQNYDFGIHIWSKIPRYLFGEGIPINMMTIPSWRSTGLLPLPYGRTFSIPIASMYGIFTYVYLPHQSNLGKCTIHGWYGIPTEPHIAHSDQVSRWNHLEMASLTVIDPNPASRRWQAPSNDTTPGNGREGTICGFHLLHMPFRKGRNWPKILDYSGIVLGVLGVHITKQATIMHQASVSYVPRHFWHFADTICVDNVIVLLFSQWMNLQSNIG